MRKLSENLEKKQKEEKLAKYIDRSRYTAIGQLNCIAHLIIGLFVIQRCPCAVQTICCQFCHMSQTSLNFN